MMTSVYFSTCCLFQGVWRGQLEGKSAAQDQAQGTNFPLSKGELTLQRQNAENLKQIFPEKEYRGLSPNFHIHVSVSEL